MRGKRVLIISIDEKGRITLPEEIRKEISADAFVVEIVDGKIWLDPIHIER